MKFGYDRLSEARLPVTPLAGVWIEIKEKTERFETLVGSLPSRDYRRKHCSRAVKKTLSIPEWLNDAAVKSGVNFSQVLQEALLEKVK